MAKSATPTLKISWMYLLQNTQYSQCCIVASPEAQIAFFAKIQRSNFVDWKEKAAKRDQSPNGGAHIAAAHVSIHQDRKYNLMTASQLSETAQEIKINGD